MLCDDYDPLLFTKVLVSLPHSTIKLIEKHTLDLTAVHSYVHLWHFPSSAEFVDISGYCLTFVSERIASVIQVNRYQETLIEEKTSRMHGPLPLIIFMRLF